jgi:hypothetical protein
MSASRRRFLQSASAVIALPFLESLVPSAARAQAARPKRLVVLFFPNGTEGYAEWMTAARPTGGFTLGTAHAALQPLMGTFSLLVNVNNTKVTGAPAHARGTASFLTGAAISNQNVATVDVSMDQVVAQAVGGTTPIRSLQLGPTPYAVPPRDTGWSSGYNTNISWTSASVPNPCLEDPLAAFARLFPPMPGTPGLTRQQRLTRSVLDGVKVQMGSMRPQLAAEDRYKLDEYLTSVRALEARLAAAPMAPMTSCGGTAPSAGLAFPEHTQAMLDVTALALQCDVTRVVTYQMDYGFGGKDFAFLLGGTRQSHHALTHTGTVADPMVKQKVMAITRWYVDRFASLVARLNATPDGPGATLLDNSIVLLGSDVGDGRNHRGANLPLVLAGKGGGSLSPGRRIDAGGVPHEQVLLALIRAMGVNQASFAGTSTAFTGL